MHFFNYDSDLAADDMADLRAEELHRRRYHNKLMRHPDPRDPDYPGDPDDDVHTDVLPDIEKTQDMGVCQPRDPS